MGKLEAGTTLRTDTGAVATVVASKIRRGEFVVYNFEVERVHNYFVKSPAGGPWILVHNNPCAEGGKFTKEMLSKAEIIAKGPNIREVKQLVQEYGGSVKGWKKMKAWDAQGVEWHWYEHHGIGRVKLKIK